MAIPFRLEIPSPGSAREQTTTWGGPHRSTGRLSLSTGPASATPSRPTAITPPEMSSRGARAPSGQQRRSIRHRSSIEVGRLRLEKQRPNEAEAANVYIHPAPGLQDAHWTAALACILSPPDRRGSGCGRARGGGRPPSLTPTPTAVGVRAFLEILPYGCEVLGDLRCGGDCEASRHNRRSRGHGNARLDPECPLDRCTTAAHWPIRT